MKELKHCDKCSYRGNGWARTGIVECCNSDCYCHKKVIRFQNVNNLPDNVNLDGLMIKDIIIVNHDNHLYNLNVEEHNKEIINKVLDEVKREVEKLEMFGGSKAKEIIERNTNNIVLKEISTIIDQLKLK